MKSLNWLFQVIAIITGLTVLWWLLIQLIDWLWATLGIEGIALVAGVSTVGVYATASKESKAAMHKYVKDQFPEVKE
jgi:Flp pilus assembly protein TadB